MANDDRRVVSFTAAVLRRAGYHVFQAYEVPNLGEPFTAEQLLLAVV
jgi:hypothetical protein